MEPVNHQWRLASRPAGALGRSNFTWHEDAAPEIAEGELLVRTIYLSLDPTNRAWVSEIPTYLPPVALGDVMRGVTLGIVERSRAGAFAPGELVQGMWGWQEYGVARASAGVTKIPAVPGVPLAAWGSVLGLTGLTAYVGLLEIGKPKPGETVVVSAAAGGVGSIVGQLAKIAGARVVGIAGGPEKCRWLTHELGFDAAIDYKHDDVATAVKRQCPSGVDVLFENVGGAIFDASFAQMNLFGRVVLCGLISGYGGKPAPISPFLLRQMIVKRLRVEGFVILDHTARLPHAAAELLGWLLEGRLKYRVDIVPGGLDVAPDAIGKLFDGTNTGKLLVEVSAPPA